MVIKTESCWIWGASVTNSSRPHLAPRWYGRFVINGKSDYAHRVSYKLFNGEIPKKMQIDHICRNTLCVNPKHLEVVTARENTVRGDAPNLLRKLRTKTHCLNGHELSGENIRYSKTGRYCIICHKDRMKRQYNKLKLNNPL